MKKLILFFKDEEGATMVEYALMIVFIALVCITVVGLLGSQVSGVFENVRAGFTGG
jgi:pilus assembly protein Flp/PilA